MFDHSVKRALQAEVQNFEIKKAFFDMASWKSPRADEFPKGFYQNTWNHISENLCTFIHQLWSKDIPLKFVNLIDICLIPKINNPQQVSHFRPISLCNTLYKVFTQVIFNRHK